MDGYRIIKVKKWNGCDNITDNKIEKLAYDKVQEKLDSMCDADKGAYMHGWFDCLYFVTDIIKRKGNEK